MEYDENGIMSDIADSGTSSFREAQALADAENEGRQYWRK